MSPTADDLVSALRREGYRLTAARRAVCEVIAKAPGEHLSAADVQARLEEGQAINVDRSTVYRTLETLEEAGLVRHGHLGHGPAVYHLADEASHQHLVCSRCGRTVAIEQQDLEETIRRIERRTGFRVDVDHFAMAGLCVDCAAD